MASLMKIDDRIRIKVLEALMAKNSVVPNIRQIQKHTGFHKATIKASLDFLKKEGLLNGFGPKIDFRKFGYKIEALSLLQLDFSEEKIFNKFLEETKNDPHTYWISSLVGSGTWNLMSRQIFSDIESFHKNEEENYFKKIPGVYNLIKDKQIFYTTEPHYKNESRTESIIKIIKKEKGID